MTTPQGPVPPPPHGEASWLDAACRGMVAYSGNPITDYARAELAALRKELSDAKAERDERTMRYWSAAEERDAARKELSNTHGLLAQARENLVAIDAQRAEAVRERDELRKELEEADSDHDVTLRVCDKTLTQNEALTKERDALRAQVAELSEAILGLGYLTGREGYCGDHAVLSVRLDPQEANKWNAIVAKLRAEPATKEEKQP